MILFILLMLVLAVILTAILVVAIPVLGVFIACFADLIVFIIIMKTLFFRKKE